MIRALRFAAAGSVMMMVGCAGGIASPFVPATAERGPGLVRLIKDEAAGVEWGLLQLERYSTLYGAKDYWITWRALGGGPPPALSELVAGAKAPPPPPRFPDPAPPGRISEPALPLTKAEIRGVTRLHRLFTEGDGEWAPPLFTGVVYTLSPYGAYLPLAPAALQQERRRLRHRPGHCREGPGTPP